MWNRLSDKEADLVPRLLGMDLLRLGLERGSTAREALDVITSLLQLHGQVGVDLVSEDEFIFLDCREVNAQT